MCQALSVLLGFKKLVFRQQIETISHVIGSSVGENDNNQILISDKKISKIKYLVDTGAGISLVQFNFRKND